jgi:Flp pilus assembly protein TadG
VIRRQRQRGQGLTEFAIVIPIIIVAIFGILDLSRAVFTYNTLAQAARQAARTAIVDQRAASVQSTAVSYAPTLGLSNANVTVCFKEGDSSQDDCSSSADDCPQSTRVLGCLAIVEADTTYTPMTPIIGSIIGAIPMSSVSIQPIEYVCPYTGKTTCP